MPVYGVVQNSTDSVTHVADTVNTNGSKYVGALAGFAAFAILLLGLLSMVSNEFRKFLFSLKNLASLKAKKAHRRLKSYSRRSGSYKRNYRG